MTKSNRRNAALALHAYDLLTDPGVTCAIHGALLARGFRKQDLQDGVQEVYLKALRLFQRAAPPPDLERMKALCAKIARDHAIDLLRKADKRRRDFVGRCDPDEYTPLEHRAEQRDPVDAGRQLEVLAQLFREGRMPRDGVDILEGVASRCTHQEIAEDLGITARAVEGRLGVMRRTYRARMARLGILPGMQPLHVLVSAPGAVDVLREAA